VSGYGACSILGKHCKGKQVIGRFSSVLAQALALCLAGPLWAQNYPAKPVRVIVPTSPGGATDVVARLVASKLGETLGQAFVVENRIGAFGTLGTDAVAKSAPDGYTLLAAFDSFTSNPYLFKSATARPVEDFAPIALLVRSPQVLVVHPQLGVKRFEDFVRVARAKGTQLNYGTAGPGTSSRLTVELVKAIAGIDPTAVHYKGGNPAMAGLLGGQVDMMIVTMGTAIEHLRAGKLIPLAVTSAKRSPNLPDVPAFAEFYPGFEAQSWVGLLAPAGTPREIVARLNGETRAAISARGSREKLEALGYEIVGSTPEEFSELIRTESAKWERVIRERGITID
jgi:tripartite-type tricarboxylate transporter receptor subunit TctC